MLTRRPALAAAATAVFLWGSALLAGPAHAGPGAGGSKKKFHFELTQVKPKPEVKPDVARTATPRIEAQVKKIFETPPQLIPKPHGAPDPKAAAEAFPKVPAQKAISGAYLVT